MRRETAILTTDEVAARLRVSKKTVLRMLRTGQLKASKIRNQWRITDGSVDELMRDGTKPAVK